NKAASQASVHASKTAKAKASAHSAVVTKSGTPAEETPDAVTEETEAVKAERAIEKKVNVSAANKFNSQANERASEEAKEKASLKSAVLATEVKVAATAKTEFTVE
ncbi:hypothetical protein QYG89_16590, partial [Bacillus sp. B190/17]